MLHLRAAVKRRTPYRGRPNHLPPNTYLLTIVNQLTITDNLTITGNGASTTIIDGNKGVRPDVEFWFIFSGTVNISGVTIRNGGKTDGFLSAAASSTAAH